VRRRRKEWLAEGGKEEREERRKRKGRREREKEREKEKAKGDLDAGRKKCGKKKGNGEGQEDWMDERDMGESVRWTAASSSLCVLGLGCLPFGGYASPFALANGIGC